MKKVFAWILSCALLVSLAACNGTGASSGGASSQPQAGEQSSETAAPGSSAPESTEEPASESTSETETGSNALVVYFSWSGNTETIANEIASQTGADIFSLTPVTPYSTDYNTVLDEAQAEQRDNARPEISGSIENFGSYEVVYLGFPNWWGDMPMILYSFLDDYDLSGKTIAPFVSSGGSGFSDSISAMESGEPDATVTEGLSLSSDASKNPGDAVTEWLDRIGLAG